MKTVLKLNSKLVEQCRANDRQAQLTLYRMYCEGMYNVVRRFINDPDDAEDVLQEAFIKAFEKLDQFRGDVSFGAWLKRIVINKSIDFIKMKRVQFTEFKDEITLLPEDDSWEVDQEVNVDIVKECMEALPESYKYVVKMYLMEGYDHAEISQFLGITETNCRSRLLRGKEKLKQLIESKYNGKGSSQNVSREA